MVTEQKKQELESLLQEKIINSADAPGGCICHSEILTLQSGKKIFLKTHHDSRDMFAKEANGLKELARAQALGVPRVYFAGEDFLLLEAIMGKGQTDEAFFQDFGLRLAKMHRFTSTQFGFHEDNYIGRNPQINRPTPGDWGKFYYERRLLFQLELSQKKGLSSGELTSGIKKIAQRMPDLIGDFREAPSLLHGDLWSGNFMADGRGVPFLIDPAVYYGDRETDLAMTRLFGGFPRAFYRAYQEEYPLRAGHEKRLPLYQLYHIMNHLNLFGGGYHSRALDLIADILS